jgi:hypothetical protein
MISENSAPIWQIERVYGDGGDGSVIEIRLDVYAPTAIADLYTTYQQFPSQRDAAEAFLKELADHPEASYRPEDEELANAIILGHEGVIVIVDEICRDHGGRNYAYRYLDEDFIRLAENCEGCVTVTIRLSDQVRAQLKAAREARPDRPSSSKRPPHPQS